MADASDQILDAVVLALNGAGKPADLTVEDHNAISLEPEALPYQSVRPHEEKDAPFGNHVVERTLTVVVASWGEGAIPRKAVGPLRAWAVRALQNSAGLGGLCTSIEEKKTVWSDEFTDQNRALAETYFEITYATDRNDPEVLR